MSRKTFLTIASLISLVVGVFAVAAPSVFLGSVKMASTSAAAEVMMRTTGVLILSVGLLAFLVRSHPDSATMRAFLFVNLFLQLAILPIDPMAYAMGVFRTLGSFVPNTILHVLLASGFAYYL